MAGEDPAEHQIGALRPEPLRGEPHRRRHGGDPVEPIEHRKQRQAVEREIGERQEQQRQAAQAVIPEQQIAIVVAVRQPARRDGAEEIENAHRRQQARGLNLRDAEIEAHRNQMHLDQPVGAGAANEEGREQDPEHPRFRGIAQRAERGGHDRRVVGRRQRQRLRAVVAERPQADIARAIAHHHQHRESRDAEHDAHQRQRDSPAHPLGQARQQRLRSQASKRSANSERRQAAPDRRPSRKRRLWRSVHVASSAVRSQKCLRMGDIGMTIEVNFGAAELGAGVDTGMR